jgi:hypothetical protein
LIFSGVPVKTVVIFFFAVEKILRGYKKKKEELRVVFYELYMFKKVASTGRIFFMYSFSILVSKSNIASKPGKSGVFVDIRQSNIYETS